MALVQMLVTEDSYDAAGVLIHAGHIGTFDTERLNGKEKHLHDASKLGADAMVEMSAVAPTGPNPTMPQQIPTDAVQGSGGQYQIPGKTLVGEVTNPQEERIDDRNLRDADHEAKVSDALADIMDKPPEAAAKNGNGTVADATANLGAKTDDQLEAQLADEKAGANRKGVVSAIEDELAKRDKAE
jgi:hypothetical protein